MNCTPKIITALRQIKQEKLIYFPKPGTKECGGEQILNLSKM